MRYLLFTWDDFYPLGGWSDVDVITDNPQDIIDFLEQKDDYEFGCGGIAHIQVVDVKSDESHNFNLCADFDDHVDPFVEAALSHVKSLIPTNSTTIIAGNIGAIHTGSGNITV